MIVVFSDLDGTLLDHETYSFKKANKALELIKKRHIPLSICTSKTQSEITYWRKQLDNDHPFIAENGGGIFIPKDYFSFDILYDRQTDYYFVIELGNQKGLVHEIIYELKRKYNIKSFLDMTAEEIAEDAQLSLTQAKLAKKREYSIPFKILDNNQTKDIINDIEKHHLNFTVGGRYHHLIGDINKGGAAKTLMYLYEKRFGENITTIGIGDSENDFPLLDVVDRAYLVKKKNGSYASNEYCHSKGIGPEGWAEIIEKELKP